MKGKTVLTAKLLVATVLAFAFIALFAQPAGAATQLVGGTLAISGVNYAPSPAEPGRYIDFFIGLDNGAYPSYDVECKLLSIFPFTVDDATQETQKLVYLPAGQGSVLKYKVRVADNAVTGYNDLSFSCRSRGADWVTAKMQVYIQVQESVVAINEVSFTPSEIQPGAQFKIRVALENSGNSPVKEVSLKLAFTDDQPFTTIGSSNTKRVALLGPKEKNDVSFDVLAYPTAAIKAYRIPLELTYYDDTGAKQTRTDYAGVVVESKPLLSIALESSTLHQTNTTGSIFVSVINKGVSDAKFLEVEIQPVAGIRVLSGATTYVGALDSDDYQTVEVKVYAETDASAFVLPVKLSFKDANNREYEQTSEITVPLYSQAELEKYGLAAPQGMILTIVVVLVVLVAAYYGYRRFVKNRPAKK